MAITPPNSQPTVDPFAEVEALMAQQPTDKFSEVEQLMASQEADPQFAEVEAEMEASELGEAAKGKGSHPAFVDEILGSYALTPAQKQQLVRSYPGMVGMEQVVMVKDFLKDIIVSDIETLKTGGEEGLFETTAPEGTFGKGFLEESKRTANVALALGDMVAFGTLIPALKKIPSAVGTWWTKKPPIIVNPETVAKAAVKADAISLEGQVDSTARTMDELVFEYTQHYDEPAQSVKTWNIGGKVSKTEQGAITPPSGATREGQLTGLTRGEVETTGGIDTTKLEQVESTAYPKVSAKESRLPNVGRKEPLLENAQQAQAAAQRAAGVASQAEDMLALGKTAESIPAKKTSLLRGLERKALAGTITVLKAAGPVGENVAKRMIRYLDVPEQKTANALADFEQQWKKLTRTEKDNIIDIRNAEFFRGHSNDAARALAKSIAPISERVKQVLPLIQKHTGSVTDLARSLGADVAEETRAFWPQHLVNPKNFENNTKFAEYLVKTKQMPDMATAKQYMAQFARKYGEHKFAGMEKARSFFVGSAKELREFGFDTELSALETYFMGANRRVQSFIEFGEEGHKGFQKLYETLAKQNPTAADVALKTFNRITNREMYDETFMKVAQGLTTYSIFRHMGLSGLMQLLSHPSLFIRAGFRKGMVGTWKGLKALNTASPEYDFARRSGSIINNIMKDVHAGYRSGASDWYLKYNGTNFFDNLTRMMASHTGNEVVKELTAKLIANPSNKYWNRVAKELEIDTTKLLQNGKLSVDEQYLAVKRWSDTTIGRTRAIDVPLLYGSPYLSMQTLFKKFAIFYTGFMYRHLYKEVFRHGNLRPLLPVAIVGLPMGEAMGNFRATVKDKERPGGTWKQMARDFEQGRAPKQLGARLLDDMLVIQMFGMFGDLALAASYGAQKGKQRLTETVVGTPISDTLNVVTVVADSAKALTEGKTGLRDHKQMLREGIKHLEGVPFGVGSWLSQWAQEEAYPELKKKQTIWRR